jgi:multiple sugar transport system ATP-binding protein
MTMKPATAEGFAVTTPPILSVRGLTKSYGQIDILRDINFDIAPGDFLVLVGPSGCGKSTLLSCIGGLGDATAGQILIDGRDVTHADPASRDMAMVFQSYALFPNLTVAQNIAFGLEVRGVSKPDRAAKSAKVAALLKIGHLLDRAPAQLSGGQRQRVAMGRALVRDPKLFLFDEPLSNLDAKLRITMRTEIKRLHARLGATMIYVTHDQVEAMTLATKILVMKDGEIQQAGTPRDIYDRPANTFVADFMGAPAMNLMTATVRVTGNAVAIDIARKDEPPICLIDHLPPARLLLRGDGPVTLGLRPEALGDTPRRADTAPQSIECLLDVVEHAGSDTFAVIEAGGADVTARFHGDSRVVSGDRAPVFFDMTKVCYFDPITGLRI